MISKEKNRELCEIAKYEKDVLGVMTEYTLKIASDNTYEISVKRKDEEKSVGFKGDFFKVFDLFRSVVDTDTLPENMEYIAEDFYSGQNL